MLNDVQCPQLPGAYGASARFETIPSSDIAQAF
jgi:hypothetical protein